jgi:hypothetical protein
MKHITIKISIRTLLLLVHALKKIGDMCLDKQGKLDYKAIQTDIIRQVKQQVSGEEINQAGADLVAKSRIVRDVRERKN